MSGFERFSIMANTRHLGQDVYYCCAYIVTHYVCTNVHILQFGRHIWTVYNFKYNCLSINRKWVSHLGARDHLDSNKYVLAKGSYSFK